MEHGKIKMEQGKTKAKERKKRLGIKRIDERKERKKNCLDKYKLIVATTRQT